MGPMFIPVALQPLGGTIGIHIPPTSASGFPPIRRYPFSDHVVRLVHAVVQAAGAGDVAKHLRAVWQRPRSPGMRCRYRCVWWPVRGDRHEDDHATDAGSRDNPRA